MTEEGGILVSSFPFLKMRLQDLKSVISESELFADVELLTQVQQKLSALGFYTAIVDGLPGPHTTKAIAAFCAAHHLNNVTTKQYGPTFAKELLEAVPSPRSNVNAMLASGNQTRSIDIKSEHIQLILQECQKQGITDKRQISYILATVYHETAHTYRPIDEYGGSKTRYAPYWGRGYVQLTWLTNYRKYSVLVGEDLVGYPEKAKEPSTAAFILVHGFKYGTFTGKTLAQYINSARCDFVGARRCINGTDKAALIAGYAHKWLACLEKGTLWL